MIFRQRLKNPRTSPFWVDSTSHYYEENPKNKRIFSSVIIWSTEEGFNIGDRR